jgi:type III secretory pathway lipoprotein EscJ
MGNWTLILSTGSPQEAQIVKGLLETHGIAAVVMDQRSSTYPPLGEAGVYVERDDVVRALYIVRKDRES